MPISRAALTAVLALQSAPALATEERDVNAKGPRPIAAIPLGERTVELLAVTERARADTPLRRAYLEECKAMSKIYPGYPQPAFVSVDLRVEF